MSATEDDTELRDLLIQNLENSGVLSRLKAEMRAAVFLAMDEQDKMENKTPLGNENLKKCLNSRDGRLVAGLILDFLQVFQLDFTLAVFQPEANCPGGLQGRDQLIRDLGLTEVNRNGALLLELLRRRQPERTAMTEELSPKHIAEARRRFDAYDKDRSGSIAKEDLRSVFTDLLPNFSSRVLETFVTEELRASDKSFSRKLDFQEFVVLYKQLFSQCRSVVEAPTSSSLSKDPRSIPSESALPPDGPRGPPDRDQGKDQDLVQLKEDPDEEDSFFDDPLPRKPFGWRAEPRTRDSSCRVESRTRDSLSSSLSERGPRGPDGANGFSGDEDLKEATQSGRDSRQKRIRESNDKTGSLVMDYDVDYDDDFNSHRSDISRGEISIGEEIEEVSIEGLNDSDKLEGDTVDLSVSQISQHNAADYMEDVP